MIDPGKKSASHSRLLSYLRRDLSALQIAGIDDEFIDSYKKLIAEAQKLLDRPSSGKNKRQESLENLDTFKTMSLDELQKFVDAETSSRNALEMVATRIFAVPRGSLRAYGSKVALKEKILELIRARNTHETIKRLASDQSNKK